MSWVRRTGPPPTQHQCVPPMRTVTTTLPPFPTSGGKPFVWSEDVPAGRFGDLWRCDACGELWRVGNGCDVCDPRSPSSQCGRGGYHPGSVEWRPALWWQRLIHRKRDRLAA